MFGQTNQTNRIPHFVVFVRTDNVLSVCLTCWRRPQEEKRLLIPMPLWENNMWEFAPPPSLFFSSSPLLLVNVCSYPGRTLGNTAPQISEQPILYSRKDSIIPLEIPAVPERGGSLTVELLARFPAPQP